MINPVRIGLLAAVAMVAVAALIIATRGSIADEPCGFDPQDHSAELADFIASDEVIRETDGVLLSQAFGYFFLRNLEEANAGQTCIYAYDAEGEFADLVTVIGLAKDDLPCGFDPRDYREELDDFIASGENSRETDVVALSRQTIGGSILCDVQCSVGRHWPVLPLLL